MPIPKRRRLFAMADDLSGAAETAAALLSPTRRCRVVLGAVGLTDGDRDTVLDLDSRHVPAATAAGRVRAALAVAGEDALILKKADSLLRGNLAAETGALADGIAGVVVAPALPALGRAVRSGVVHVGGVPLHESGAWRAEPVAPPRSLAEALAPHPVTLVPLAAVRASRRELAAALREAAAAGRIAVCDAETDADLDAVAGAALCTAPAPRLVGSGGLAAAVRRVATAVGSAGPAGSAGSTGPGGSAGSGGAADPAGHAVPRGREPRPVLVVVGTAEPSAAEQVRRLVREGAAHLAVSAAELLTPAVRLTLPHPSPVTVVTIAPGAAPGPPRRLAQALATAVASAVERHGAALDLVLTGGETARRTLDALGVAELEPLGQVHHGAVLSAAPDGRSVVTRPGSFGDADSLRHIVRALASAELP